MSIYNVAGYDAGDYYGDSPKLQYYAEPFTSIAISYSEIKLNWVRPAGDYIEFRVVRSYDGFPETAEDGYIVYSWIAAEGGALVTNFTDGRITETPLVPGRFTYYRIWLRTPGNIWKIAADSYSLLPMQHTEVAPDGTILDSTKNKLLEIIPKVFTTESQSPVEEIDENSDLAKFLSAPAFELDRILTYAELLLPEETGRLLSPEILLLQSLQLGLPIEPYLATKQQRRLAREALYIYQTKGTYSSLGDFVESLTGFAPEISPSPNLVLTPQDSSFTGGVGFWHEIGDVELDTSTTVPGVPPAGVPPVDPEDPPRPEPYVDDYRYVAELVVNEPGARISTGEDDPIRKGTPVESGEAYVFSGYAKAAEGETMAVTAYALWYDYKGQLIDTDPPRTFVQTPQVVGDDWTRFQFVGRSPGVEKNIQAYSVEDGVITIFLTDINTMVRGETIIIEGIPELVNTESGRAIYQIDGAGNPLEIPEGGLLGLLNSSANQVYLLTDLPDTPIVEVSGKMIEATPSVVPVPSVIMAGEIIDGEATVTFATPHGLSIDDKIVIQAMSTYFSYGVHTLTAVDATTVSFNIYEPFTGEPATTVDESFPITGVPYGFAVKLLPGTATPVPKANYAAFELVFNNTGTVYLDLFQMASFTVQEFHEARGVEMFLLPVKSNFLRNPGFNPTTLPLTWTVAAESYAAIDRTDEPLEFLEPGYALEVETLNSTPTYGMAAYAALAGVVTITMATPHDLSAGDIVLISGQGLQPVYGQHVLVASDATSISFMLPLPDTALTPLLAAVTHLKYVAVGYSVSNNVATVTLAAPHGIEEGQVVNIAGFGSPLPIWGQHLISAVGISTISFSLESPDVFSTPITSVVTALTTVSSTSGVIRSGRYISGSFYAKTLEEDSTEQFTVVLSAVNALSQEVLYTHQFDALVTDKLQRFQGSLFVPKIDPEIIVVNMTIVGQTTGNTVYFDRAQVEDSFIATDYFDGNLPAQYGIVWESLPNASTSHAYPGLAQKITRLRQELEKYLPMNTSFLIEWYGGGIAKPSI
jgi:hypothetical protein